MAQEVQLYIIDKETFSLLGSKDVGLDLGEPDYWGTDRVLLSMLGKRDGIYCSVGGFVKLPSLLDGEMEEFPWPVDALKMHFPSASFAIVNMSDLFDPKYWSRRILREAYVDARAGYLFNNEKNRFPQDEWPLSVPEGYASGSMHGVLVRWTDQYSEAVDPEFWERLQKWRQIKENQGRIGLFVMD